MITFACVLVVIVILVVLAKGRECVKCFRETCCTSQTPTSTVLRSGLQVEPERPTFGTSVLSRQPNQFAPSVSLGMTTLSNNYQTPSNYHGIAIDDATLEQGRRKRHSLPPSYDDIFGQEDGKFKEDATPTAPPLTAVVTDNAKPFERLDST